MPLRQTQQIATITGYVARPVATGDALAPWAAEKRATLEAPGLHVTVNVDYWAGELPPVGSKVRVAIAWDAPVLDPFLPVGAPPEPGCN